MPHGIILAGGYSSRAKQNKMLFDIDGIPLLEHTVNSMRPHVDRLVVVSGRYHKEVERLFEDAADVVIVHNPRFEAGMFTSVQCGVRQMGDDFFMLPGDIPFVRFSTYRALLEAQGPIRVPKHGKRRGHPLFIEKALAPDILALSETANLKTFRKNHPLTEVTVEDPGVLFDVDTPEDYRKALNWQKGDHT